MRDALKRDVQVLHAQVTSSHAALAADVRQLLTSIDARNDIFSSHLNRLVALLNGGATIPVDSSGGSVTANSSLASSASHLPSTPDALRRGTSTQSTLSPEVKGLLSELDVLDLELERRRSTNMLVEPVPIASLAPNALADDSEHTADGDSVASSVASPTATASGRKAIVSSIVANEEDYLDSIGALVKGYLEPLQAHAEANSSIVSLQEVAEMFSTIKQVYESHRQLKLQLQNRVRDWQNQTEVGDILCELPELFEPYNEYILKSDAASELLSQRMDDRTFASLIETLRRDRRELRGRSLDELLRLPLKRVEQYVAPLTALVTATNESHGDYANTTRALNYMRAFNADLWAVARQRDKMLEIKSLVSDFQGLVLPNRVFLRDGPLLDLTDSKANKGRPIHVFLFNDLLMACQLQKNKPKPLILNRRSASHKPYKFLFKIDIDSSTTIVEEITTPEGAAAAAAAAVASGGAVVDGPTNLILKAFDRTVILQATSPAERAAWALAIQEALDKAALAAGGGRGQRSRTVAGSHENRRDSIVLANSVGGARTPQRGTPTNESYSPYRGGAAPDGGPRRTSSTMRSDSLGETRDRTGSF